MHRSLFGQMDETPMKHDIQQVYTKKAGKQPVSTGLPAAGTGNWSQVDKAANVRASQDMPLYQQYPSSSQ